MKSFAYHAPSTVEEAVSLLEQLEGESRLLAGGTDLLIQMKRRLVNPQAIIALNKIASLHYFVEEAANLSFGAFTRVSELEFNTVVCDKAGVLAEAAGKLGSRQIRNISTVGGNICNAAPSAELAPPLLVLNAQIHLQGAEGKRSVPIESFFTAPRQTVRQPTEVLTGFTVDKYVLGTRAVYLRYTRRRAMDIALVSVAVRVDLAPDGLTVQSARVALGAVAPTPIRVKEAEAILIGRELQAEVIAQAGKVAAEAASPITDIRSSADYRRHLVNILTVRALNQVAQARHLS